jgi:beta-glucanase (GH16 family)
MIKGKVGIVRNRNKNGVAGLFLIACSICSISFSQAATGGWAFSWSDEFSGPAVDTSVWGYEIGYVRNNEAQYYANRTENSRIENGALLIQALRDNWNGHVYTSASRTTWNKKSWMYGRFEMRAQIDIRQGSWPAWWWLPNSGGWPKGGEIDMMEFYRGMALFNVMDGNQKWTSITKQVSTLGGDRWAGEYHVWTMEWDSLKIDLSLDGTLINHYLCANADGTGPSGTNPFRHPGYMIVNQAIGGNSGGDPSGTSFPVNYRIDWIRVHTWSNATAYMLTVNSGAGSGPYVAGTKASITAAMPPSGQIFDKWVINAGSPAIDTLTNASAVITMPSSDATVTATYKVKTSAIRNNGQSPAMGLSCAGDTSPFLVYDIFGRKLTQSFQGKTALHPGVYIVKQRGSLSRAFIIQQ